MSTEKLQHALQVLAQQREQKAAQVAKTMELQDAYFATPEYQAYQQAAEALRAMEFAAKQYEGLVRDLTIEAYQATGAKNPIEGVAIREYTRIDYDRNQAMAWCEHYAPAFIVPTLDAKAFDKVAETMAAQGAPVKVWKEPRPTIATDLKAYLQQPEPSPSEAAEEETMP